MSYTHEIRLKSIRSRSEVVVNTLVIPKYLAFCLNFFLPGNAWTSEHSILSSTDTGFFPEYEVTPFLSTERDSPY